MSNDRFKFRCACFIGKEFIGFAYMDGLDSYWDYTQTGTDSDITGKTAYTSEPEQCTGLKDKNGNLIYESDIVRLASDETDVKAVVIFQNGCFCPGDDEPFGDSRMWEIIGNVHTEE